MDKEVEQSAMLKVENDITSGSIKNCALCGCSTPAVKCDRCNSQTFCLSCDDMYHRHPKRKFHLRKAVDSIWSSQKSPRLRRRTELPGDPSKIPIPPPRTKKRPSAPSLGIFNPKFDVPAFAAKNILSKKNGPSQNGILSIRTPSPLEANYQNAERGQDSIEADNFSSNISHSPSKATYELGIQRRNSADNPRSVPTTSLAEHVALTGTVPMSSPNQNFLGYQQQGQNMHHSSSATDLTGAHPMCQFPQHLHAFMHPQINPYSVPLANFNCPQCSPALWSNMMNQNMMHYHAHPWNPAQGIINAQNQISPMPSDTHTPASDSGSHVPFQQQNGGLSPITSFEKSHDIKTEQLRHAPSPTVDNSPTDEEIAKAQLAQLLGSEAEESAEDEDDGKVVERLDIDAAPVIPDKPAEPWTCIHCTYINPAGSHVCEVCCKTSYHSPDQRIKVQKSTKKKGSPCETEDTRETTAPDKSTPHTTPSSSGQFEQVMQ